MQTKLRLLAVFCVCALLFSALCGCGDSENSESTLPTPKALKWAVGAALPRAEDFFDRLPDGSTVRYASEYRFSSMGEHKLTVIYTDAEGEEFPIEVTLTLAIDETEPRIVGAKDNDE